MSDYKLFTSQQLLVCAGDFVTLRTNGSAVNSVVYNTSAILVDGHRHMTLHVIACQSAYLALSLLPTTTSAYTYELALGIDANTKSELRTAVGGVAVAEYAGQVLDCSLGNDFWMSWTSTGVSVGSGSVFGANTMLQWQDPDSGHDVNCVSFASQSPTQWQISTVVGQCVIFCVAIPTDDIYFVMF